MELAATAMTGEDVTAMIRGKSGGGVMSAVDSGMSAARAGSSKGGRAEVEMPGRRLACNCR